MKIDKAYILILVFSLLLTACHRKQPKDVISDAKMESILYDIHIANGMAKQQSDSSEFYSCFYYQEVLKNHHISEKDFEKSLLWYSQHTASLYKIYEKINTRLEHESMSLGVVTSDAHYYASLTENGDTANIWQGNRFYLLSPMGINNRMSFSVNADSTHYENDTYVFHFFSKFLVTEGPKEAIVNFSITYDNDSVQSLNTSIFGDGESNIQLLPVKRKVKQIRGFIYLGGQYSDHQKLLFVMSPALIRSHEKKENASREEQDKEQKLQVDSATEHVDGSKAQIKLLDDTQRAKPVPLRKRMVN